MYIVANSPLKVEKVFDSPKYERTTFLLAPSQVAQSEKRLKLKDENPSLATILSELKQIKAENNELKELKYRSTRGSKLKRGS